MHFRCGSRITHACERAERCRMRAASCTLRDKPGVLCVMLRLSRCWVAPRGLVLVLLVLLLALPSLVLGGRDLYASLGVRRDASDREIKKAYRKVCV